MRTPETPAQRRAAEAQLDQMRAKVAEWLPLLNSPITPAPHSSLAADDTRGWSRYPPSQVAWTGITAAVDSLDHFLASLRPPGRAHDTGHRVLARSALTSAAMAINTVCPPARDDRVGFSLRCAWDDVRSERRAVEGLRDSGASVAEPVGPQTWRDATASFDRRESELLQLADRIGLSRNRLRKLEFAETVESATTHLQRSDGPYEAADDAAALGFTLAQLNGTVHASRWSMLLGIEEVREGMSGSFARVGTTATDLAQMAGAGTVMTMVALSTFERRAQR